MSTETDTATEQNTIVMDITPEAMVQVQAVLAAEEDPENLALRVEITGSQGVDYTYDLAFEALDQVASDDVVYRVGEERMPVIVPAATVDKLQGATLDLPSNPIQGGLVIRNPNRPNPLEGSNLELTGTIEEKLDQLLRHTINPALAAHGGYVEVQRIDGTNVYITMGGGCQGCSMSAITLRDGITTMIAQSIPEVTEVIDLTEHDLGENPYFD